MGIEVALGHRTSYTFDRSVEVYPHVIRLRPAPHSRAPSGVYWMTVEPEVGAPGILGHRRVRTVLR
ncbi:hypothetical protein NIIDNTM18_22720 [Mycolicibacterium litorale]|uniref:Bacterial transglutaminase-like N-terminal domain-containing protein n=1 Tax=Mycolicibacterium litorale TaxID=758802 RepID=A0A6S6P2M5_9MYCO|nr:transglutaminase N-terminal domain-containing protein [Mycolicibacterium litorale]BCI52994.1 hypothetical protein NIIDNTM18_22720 [Mycolicibacterium litorale]